MPQRIRGAGSGSNRLIWRLRVKKSDVQLQQHVLAELKWEPLINAAEIGVEVKDGIVTLVGMSILMRRNGTQSVRRNALPASKHSPSSWMSRLKE